MTTTKESRVDDYLAIATEMGGFFEAIIWRECFTSFAGGTLERRQRIVGKTGTR